MAGEVQWQGKPSGRGHPAAGDIQWQGTSSGRGHPVAAGHVHSPPHKPPHVVWHVAWGLQVVQGHLLAPTPTHDMGYCCAHSLHHAAGRATSTGPSGVVPPIFWTHGGCWWCRDLTLHAMNQHTMLLFFNKSGYILPHPPPQVSSHFLGAWGLLVVHGLTLCWLMITLLVEEFAGGLPGGCGLAGLCVG